MSHRIKRAAEHHGMQVQARTRRDGLCPEGELQLEGCGILSRVDNEGAVSRGDAVCLSSQRDGKLATNLGRQGGCTLPG